MIPVETWTYIVARVRKEFPDTIFMLEGLGGKVEVTEELLTVANLDWAYSELFQTEDRGAFDWYLPRAIPLAERCGPLIHFAETHDNNRLAARGECYARMRVALSALLSHQGAFGITAGVEWFATEKVDVHGASALNWDAPHNQVAEIARLNALLETHPAFGPGTRLRPVQRGDGPFLAVLRDIDTDAAANGSALLVLVNSIARTRRRRTGTRRLSRNEGGDLVTGEAFALTPGAGLALAPGRACCLTLCAEDVAAVDAAAAAVVEPAALSRRRRNLMALRVKLHLAAVDNGDDDERFACTCEPDELGAAMTADPDAFCADAPEPTAAPHGVVLARGSASAGDAARRPCVAGAGRCALPRRVEERTVHAGTRARGAAGRQHMGRVPDRATVRRGVGRHTRRTALAGDDGLHRRRRATRRLRPAGAAARRCGAGGIACQRRTCAQ